MKKYIVALMAVMALTACGPAPMGVPQLDSVTGQPVPVAQHQGGFDMGSAAIGALGGAVVGNMMGKSAAQQHVIVDRRPVYVAPSPSYYGGRRSTVTTTTTNRSMLGGRTITRTVTRRR